MTKECLFSGEPSENIEHVIPRWLARKYKLSNQTYTLPNGTHIKYKHAKVPSKKSHNDKFSLIEDNIASGIYDPFEVYLWAFKIHIGLKYIDKDLPVNRKDKASDKILDDEYISKMLKLFRVLYLAWSSGKIIPDVLGSVIIEDSKLPEDYFDMIDMLHGFLQYG